MLSVTMDPDIIKGLDPAADYHCHRKVSIACQSTICYMCRLLPVAFFWYAGCMVAIFMIVC